LDRTTVSRDANANGMSHLLKSAIDMGVGV